MPRRGSAVVDSRRPEEERRRENDLGRVREQRSKTRDRVDADPRRSSFVRRRRLALVAVGRERAQREPSPPVLAQDARLVDGRDLDQFRRGDPEPRLLGQLAYRGRSSGLADIDAPAGIPQEPLMWPAPSPCSIKSTRPRSRTTIPAVAMTSSNEPTLERTLPECRPARSGRPTMAHRSTARGRCPVPATTRENGNDPGTIDGCARPPSSARDSSRSSSRRTISASRPSR